MLNKTVIHGRLTRDVELRHTQSGTAVASFTIAWSEKYKEKEQKLFMPCVAWGNNGEFAARYFSKGQEAIAEGKLISRKWQDKDGNNRETVELIVDKLHFCGPKQDSQPNYSGSYAPAAYAPNAPLEELDVDDDDLPF